MQVPSLPPYIALTISTISRAGVKINVSCYMLTGVSKGTPCDAKCVTEILGRAKIRKLRGQSLNLVS